MAKYWKPTADDCKRIRDHAKSASSSGWVRVELGERIDNNEKISPNLNLVGNVDQSDLHDFIDWPTFKKNGVELDASGNAVLDFYVYSQIELSTNIEVTITNGQISKLG